MQQPQLMGVSLLAYTSVTRAVKAFHAAELTPEALLHAHWQQDQLWCAHTNPITARFDESALSEARNALQRYQSGVAKPLDGLAVAIKDESYIANQVTTNGSLLLQHNRVTTTDPVPQRLLDQGAYIHARTTTPEFSTAGVTWSRLWGVTRNPWNTAITCGGSSGGSAVAVATGMASFANGTDAGGSIRIPAALCGLYGYKAPHGRVPEIAPYGLEPYCHHGVLTRTLDDLLYLYPLIKGQHFSDLHSFVPDVNPHLISDKTLNKIRVAVSADLGFYHVEPDIVVALHNTVNELRNIGVEVEWVKIGWDERVIETAKVHQWAMLGQMLRQKYSSTADRALMTSYAQNYLMGADNLRVSDIVAANLYAAKMWESLAEVFQQYDVLLCPTMASNAIAADFDYSRDRAFINGKEVDANKGWFMTYAFNTLNSCPVLAMPNGRSQNGVPTSVQIVGRPYEEAYLFEVARHLSRTLAADFFHTLFPSLPNASN